MPGFPVLHHLPDFAQTHFHGISDAIQPSYPLSSPSPPAPNPSQHQSLFHKSTLLMRWPNYWSFIISPSKEYSGLISFSTDWFDLCTIQGTPTSLLQYHNLKVSVLWRSAFFMVQLSHPYMTTGKTIALTIWTFVSKLKVKGTQSHLTLSDPMDYIVHGILQAKILEWVVFPFSRGSSQPRD